MDKRKTFHISDSQGVYYVSLTSDQIQLLKWLSDYGFLSEDMNFGESDPPKVEII